MIIRFIFYVLILTLWSCGSHHKVIDSESSYRSDSSTIFEEKKAVALESYEKELTRALFSLNFRAGKLEVKPDGTILAEDVEVTQDEVIDNELIKSTTSEENKEVIAAEGKTDELDTSDRSESTYSQYNWWYGLPLVVIIIAAIWFLIYIYIKYSKWTNI